VLQVVGVLLHLEEVTMDAELIEVDGRFAVRDFWIDDWGCRRAATRVTPHRVGGSTIERSELPLEAHYDSYRRMWAAYRPGSDKPIWIDGLPEQADVEAVALADVDVPPAVLARRVRRLAEMIEAQGRRFVRVGWRGKRRPSKKAISLFTRWAEHVLAGGDPEYQPLWDELYAADGAEGYPTTNAVYETAIPTGRPPHTIEAGDVVALFSKDPQIPDVVITSFGDVPVIDWCAPEDDRG